MYAGAKFFSNTTLTTNDNPNVVYQPGLILSLVEQISDGDIWEAVDCCGRTFYVTPLNGVIPDYPEMEDQLFRRAIAKGYKGHHGFFVDGYNRILQMKLKVAEQKCHVCLTSEEALEKAIDHDHQLDRLNVFDNGYEMHQQCRDDYLKYAEVLSQIERLFVQYEKDSAVLFKDTHG